MKLTSTLFRSRDYGALPSGDLNPPAGEAGSDGDTLMADLSAGGPDVNPELTGSAKFAVYDEMRKTDPTIKSVLWFLGLPIRSASWGLDPSDESDPVSRLVRDFVAWNLGLETDLGEMGQSWEKTVAQGLEMMAWGAMFEELIWDRPPRGQKLREWRDADGDVHPVIPLARLAPRRPGTVDRIERNPDGSIKRLTQNLPGTLPIAGDKLCYMVFEDSETGAWDGVSVLRPAWLSWRLKKSLMISAGIGWDRFALGLPVVYHPDTPDGEAKAKTIGRSIRSHERAYVHFPVPAGGSKADSEWALEIMNAADSLADPTPLIKLCSDQEAEAGLQQFTRQGLGQTGARATSQTQSEPFYLAVEAIAKDLKRERMRQVIRRIVKVNFGREIAETRCPVLNVSRIIPRDVETISRALSYLNAAGFTFTDRGAVDDVRELVGFGQLPDELQAQGIQKDALVEILKSLGLDSQTFAQIVNALPPDVGVAPNRVPEGTGLPLAA